MARALVLCALLALSCCVASVTAEVYFKETFDKGAWGSLRAVCRALFVGGC